MRTLAVAIERNCLFTKSFESEPYEAGWASEARWFIHVFSLRRGAQLRLVPQISFDGLFWCDYTAADQKPLVLEIKSAGLMSVPLTHFGHWSRFRVVVARPGRGPGPVAGFHLQLVLKG